ncbi:hypothetical protein CPB85DRAFT_1567667 [Mucidula mucida]|nr:hypothetical protein CPB85DRAFT_1567667 [Mucidula mucida]
MESILTTPLKPSAVGSPGSRVSPITISDGFHMDSDLQQGEKLMCHAQSFHLDPTWRHFGGVRIDTTLFDPTKPAVSQSGIQDRLREELAQLSSWADTKYKQLISSLRYNNAVVHKSPSAPSPSYDGQNSPCPRTVSGSWMLFCTQHLLSS